MYSFFQMPMYLWVSPSVSDDRKSCTFGNFFTDSPINFKMALSLLVVLFLVAYSYLVNL